MNVGEEWIYRFKDKSLSERVRILAIQRKKTSSRVDVELLDDCGPTENVPGHVCVGRGAGSLRTTS